MTGKKTTNFRALNDELEQIMDKFQADDIDVDEAISLYERAQKIIEELEVYLKGAENKIKTITLSKEK
jgi:exodeoxyribonuclease VII small subunit